MVVAVISELFVPPFDEGFKKTATAIVEALGRRHEVRAIRGGPGRGEPLNARSGFTWCWKAAAELRHLKPDCTIYIPAASLSFFSFVRGYLLKKLSGRRGPAVLVGLQARSYGNWQRRLLPWLKPDLVFVQTRREQEVYAGWGMRAATLPSGVDLERFQPVDAATRAALRARLGLEPTARVLLHVGHLKPGRNLEILAGMQGQADVQVVVVSSTSTLADRAVKAELDKAGVRVVDTLVEAVEQWYQASDCYVFPVLEAGSAIGFPLSVLEAMACNLPVVTTRFGGLPEAFQGVEGVHFWDGRAPLLPSVDKALSEPARTREAVQPYSWDAVAERIEREIGRLAGV